MRNRARLSTAGILVFSMALSASGPAAANDGAAWPMMLGNPAHTSYSSDAKINAANAATFGVKWMANLYNADLGSPVVAYNQTLAQSVVYVGNQRGDLFGIDAATGRIIWSTNLGVNNKMQDAPAVASDGSVWIGTSTNPTLFKVNGATGAVECSIKVTQPITGSPAIATPKGGTETVYWDYTSSPGTTGPLIATRVSDCSQIFTFSGYKVSAGSSASPAEGASKTGEPLAFIGTSAPDSQEYAVDANTGALSWSFAAFNPAPGNFDIADGATVSAASANAFPSGAVYFTTKHGNVYAVNLTTGALLWYFDIAPANASSSRSSAALDGKNLVMGYGENSGFGGAGGVYSLNAYHGTVNWQFTDPVEVISSPAIVGPSGSEVVAFGDLNGAFNVLSLATGAQIYKGQTGGYIVSSPAEAGGTVYVTSSDGFLYAYGPGGSNASPPSTQITSPTADQRVPNPGGMLTITGTSSDAAGVSGVEIAIQENGTSGPWYNATSGGINSAPVRNAALLASLGAASTTWTFSFPAPAAGGSFEVFASTINASNIADKGANAFFTVAPGAGQGAVILSAPFASPGSTIGVHGGSFRGGEQVNFSLFGALVGNAKANSSGATPVINVTIPNGAAFGPTSVTATGLTSGRSATATLNVVDDWLQSGHDATHLSFEANDAAINSSPAFGNGTVLQKSWQYAAGAAVTGSLAIQNRFMIFGNGAGTISSVSVDGLATAWTYHVPGALAVSTTPAIDSSGNTIVATANGSIYRLDAHGQQAGIAAIGGALTSPAVNNNQIYVESDNATLDNVTDDSAFAVRWTASLARAGHATPAYDSANFMVVAGDDSGRVTAVNSGTGVVQWTFDTKGAVLASPLIYNGIVYIASMDGNVYALKEGNGVLQWQVAMTGPISASPALYTTTAPVLVAAADANGTIDFINASGTVVTLAPTAIKSPAGLSAVKGNLIVTYANGTVGLVRPNSSTPLVWSYATGETLSSQAPVVDGTVYVPGSNGTIYAFTPQGATPLSRGRPGVTAGDGGAWECTTP